jgi:hypothetical protein
LARANLPFTEWKLFGAGGAAWLLAQDLGDLYLRQRFAARW